MSIRQFPTMSISSSSPTNKAVVELLMKREPDEFESIGTRINVRHLVFLVRDVKGAS